MTIRITVAFAVGGVPQDDLTPTITIWRADAESGPPEVEAAAMTKMAPPGDYSYEFDDPDRTADYVWYVDGGDTLPELNRLQRGDTAGGSARGAVAPGALSFDPSSVDVASKALARLGEPAISSFEEDSDTAEKVFQLYEPTILQLLSSHDWSFARRRAVLEEDAAGTPVNEWTRAFLLPPLHIDRVGKPLAVFNTTSIGARPVFEYEMHERWVMTNYEQLVVEYIWRVPESQWPGYFLTLAIAAVAATLAVPVTENETKEERQRRIAFGDPSEFGRGGLFRTAADADATGDPTRSLLDDDNLTAIARFGGQQR